MEGAEHVCNNAVDVSLLVQGIQSAAESIHAQMQRRSYSTATWSEHELHPKSKDEAAVNFIFTMDLLNFSFWSEKSSEERFTVAHKRKRWTGYWSLVAALQRALDEGGKLTVSADIVAKFCQIFPLQNAVSGIITTRAQTTSFDESFVQLRRKKYPCSMREFVCYVKPVESCAR